uniref:Uncharacterized protein n=1 Tax=Heterorhabditis bacteriophora TaxID=37862 RepID=A0A1I7XCT7_HETBA
MTSFLLSTKQVQSPVPYESQPKNSPLEDTDSLIHNKSTASGALPSISTLMPPASFEQSELMTSLLKKLSHESRLGKNDEVSSSLSTLCTDTNQRLQQVPSKNIAKSGQFVQPIDIKEELNELTESNASSPCSQQNHINNYVGAIDFARPELLIFWSNVGEEGPLLLLGVVMAVKESATAPIKLISNAEKLLRNVKGLWQDYKIISQIMSDPDRKGHDNCIITILFVSMSHVLQFLRDVQTNSLSEKRERDYHDCWNEITRALRAEWKIIRNFRDTFREKFPSLYSSVCGLLELAELKRSKLLAEQKKSRSKLESTITDDLKKFMNGVGETITISPSKSKRTATDMTEEPSRKLLRTMGTIPTNETFRSPTDQLLSAIESQIPTTNLLVPHAISGQNDIFQLLIIHLLSNSSQINADLPFLTNFPTNTSSLHQLFPNLSHIADTQILPVQRSAGYGGLMPQGFSSLNYAANVPSTNQLLFSQNFPTVFETLRGPDGQILMPPGPSNVSHQTTEQHNSFENYPNFPSTDEQ